VLITNHVLSGALVGLAVRRPLPAFVAGVASHAALDATPHWGDERYDVFLEVAVVDGLVGLAAMGAVARACPADRRAAVVAGMVGACLPDADKPSTLFLGRSPFPAAVDAWHQRIQRESPRRAVQEPLVALGLAWAVRRVLSAAG